MIKYGGIREYEGDCKEEMKEELREDLHILIDALCDQEEFWIVKEPFEGNKNAIGYRIDIPQMELPVTAKNNSERINKNETAEDC